jgi:hypothetical protein
MAKGKWQRAFMFITGIAEGRGQKAEGRRQKGKD